MKRLRILFAVALALLVSLSMLVMATPVLAAESVQVSPVRGEVGDQVDMEGTGYTTANGSVDIYFCASSDPDIDVAEGDRLDRDVESYELLTSRSIVADTAVPPDPDEGTWTLANRAIPARLTDGDVDIDVTGPGTYYFAVTYDGDDDIVAVDTFTIRGITLDPVEGNIFTQLEITGLGFTPNKNLTVEYDGEALEILSGDIKSKSTGKFVSVVEIPESAAGEHEIEARVSTSEISVATFTITSNMLAQPTSGKADETGNVTGSGFAANSTITVTLGGVEAGVGSTDEVGTFDVEFTVPDIEAGVYDLIAEDGEGNSGTVDFTVEETPVPTVTTPQPTSSSSPGYLGMDYTISGTDFLPTTQVTVTFTSTPVVVATVTTDADGAFTAAFKVPKTEPGAHTITATDGTNTLEIPFFMDSTAPAVPIAALPAAGSSAEVQSVFDWTDVTDPSGVTYSIQIATSPDFAVGTVLVDKSGLTESTYVIPEASKLLPNEKDESYYWRVRAIDNINNVGSWSAPSAFTVAAPPVVSNVSPVILYVGIALGGIALFVVGFWIGRRTSYAG